MYKSLIVYYSYSGTTKHLAETITIITDGDIRELVPEKPYSLTYNGATKEARNEIERGYCPKLLMGAESVDNYDHIYIGSPNWFKSLAPPVLSFLRSVDLKGKTVIPFCTHGGGGFGSIESDILKECPQSIILSGFETTSAFNDDQVEIWINSMLGR